MICAAGKVRIAALRRVVLPAADLADLPAARFFKAETAAYWAEKFVSLGHFEPSFPMDAK